MSKPQRYTASCGSLWFGYKSCDEHDEDEQVCKSEDVEKLEDQLEEALRLLELEGLGLEDGDYKKRPSPVKVCMKFIGNGGD